MTITDGFVGVIDKIVNFKENSKITLATKERHEKKRFAKNLNLVFEGLIAPRHHAWLYGDTIEVFIPEFPDGVHVQFPLASLRQIRIYPEKDFSLCMQIISDVEDDLAKGHARTIKKIDPHKANDLLSHLDRLMEGFPEKHFVVEGRSYLNNPPKPGFLQKVGRFIGGLIMFAIGIVILLMIVGIFVGDS